MTMTNGLQWRSFRKGDCTEKVDLAKRSTSNRPRRLGEERRLVLVGVCGISKWKSPPPLEARGRVGSDLDEAGVVLIEAL